MLANFLLAPEGLTWGKLAADGEVTAGCKAFLASLGEGLKDQKPSSKLAPTE